MDRLDRSVLKAIRYARAVEATDIRALHAAVDVERAEELLDRWAEAGVSLGIPLEVAECPWNGRHRLVRLALKGKEVPAKDRPACNLGFCETR